MLPQPPSLQGHGGASEGTVGAGRQEGMWVLHKTRIRPRPEDRKHLLWGIWSVQENRPTGSR